MTSTRQQPVPVEDHGRMQLAPHHPADATALMEAHRKRHAPDVATDDLITVRIQGRPELGPLEFLPTRTASDIIHALSEELGVGGGWLRADNRFFMGRDRVVAGEFVFRPKGAPGGPSALLTRADLAEQLAAHSEGLARQLAEVRKRIVVAAPSDDEDILFNGPRLTETRVWEHVGVPMEPRTPMPKGVGHARLGEYVDCAVEFARDAN